MRVGVAFIVSITVVCVLGQCALAVQARELVQSFTVSSKPAPPCDPRQPVRKGCDARALTTSDAEMEKCFTKEVRAACAKALDDPGCRVVEGCVRKPGWTKGAGSGSPVAPGKFDAALFDLAWNKMPYNEWKEGYSIDRFTILTHIGGSAANFFTPYRQTSKKNTVCALILAYAINSAHNLTFGAPLFNSGEKGGGIQPSEKRTLDLSGWYFPLGLNDLFKKITEKYAESSGVGAALFQWSDKSAFASLTSNAACEDRFFQLLHESGKADPKTYDYSRGVVQFDTCAPAPPHASGGNHIDLLYRRSLKSRYVKMNWCSCNIIKFFAAKHTAQSRLEEQVAPALAGAIKLGENISSLKPKPAKKPPKKNKKF